MEHRQLRFKAIGVEGGASITTPGDGAVETHIVLKPEGQGTIEDQLVQLEKAYEEALHELDLVPESAALRRLFASDLINQIEVVRQSALARDAHLSVVEQPPLPEAKVALHAYHVTDSDYPLARNLSDARAVEWHHHGCTHLQATGLTAAEKPGSYAQAGEIFRRFERMLLDRGMTLAENAMRTWIYVQNLDTDYMGVVRARREFFTERGLTADTHYIASTGIAGGAGDAAVHVTMDAYAVKGLVPEQVHYLKALDHLSPTHTYGVTFERGTAIVYGDRRHLLLSGTASIDSEGEIVHSGNVVKQLERTLENMGALLADGGAALEHMTHMLIYLRDGADCKVVTEAFRAQFPDLPCLILRAPVCRPGWLIELEGTAIVRGANPQFAPF